MCGAKLSHHKENVLMERPQQCGSRPAKTGPVPVRVKTVSMESQPKRLFRPDAPMSKRRRLYCTNFLMRPGRSECSD